MIFRESFQTFLDWGERTLPNVSILQDRLRDPVIPLANL